MTSATGQQTLRPW